jgi:periplasmic divalent cation tolerance protein
MTNTLIVLTTFPDHDAALEVAGRLVREKLAACVNVLPRITSVYEWQGEAQIDNEHLMLAKTSISRFAELEAAIRDSHPYELPEIVGVPITQGLQGYLDWIELQTTAEAAQ